MDGLITELLKLGEFGALCVVVIYGVKYIIPALKNGKSNHTVNINELRAVMVDVYETRVEERLKRIERAMEKSADNQEKMIRLLLTGRFKGGPDSSP